MMNCKEAAINAEKMQEGKLPLMKRLEVRMHVLFCNKCRQVRSRWNWILRQFSDREPIKMPDKDKEELIQSLNDIQNDHS